MVGPAEARTQAAVTAARTLKRIIASSPLNAMEPALFALKPKYFSKPVGTVLSACVIKVHTTVTV